MQEPPPQAVLGQMITGALTTQAIYAAAKLGIADLLSAGPKDVDELGSAVQAHPEALYRLLRTLSSVGVFTETEPRRFALTPMSQLLRRDVPGSQWAFAIMVGELMYKQVGEFLHSIQTGGTAFEKFHGMPVFDFLAQHPDYGRLFDQAMTSVHGGETQPVVDAYDFTQFKTIVDVGGGNGSALMEILRAAPSANGIVFDMPSVIGRTSQTIRDAGMSNRCRGEGGSFFELVPRGADCYVLRHIVHDWDDERSALILRNCRNAAAPGAKVLVVESVIPPGNQPHPGKWLDLIMLSVAGGRERTAEEFQRLFAEAGLRLTRIVPTASPVSVLEGEVC